MGKERPGTMIYFDLLPVVQCLSREAAGNLLVAMLEYGKDGKLPDFSTSEGLNVAWVYAKQMIDRDKARYANRILRHTYGGYKREAQRREEEILSFEGWYQQIYLPSLEPGEEPPLPPLSLPETGKSAEPSASGKRRGGGQRFAPPTVEEVRAYCAERRNGVDPEAFVDFYASKGWRVGNQPMKDWKASVRMWERRNGGGQRGNDPRAERDALPFEYNPGDMSGSL